MRKLSKLGETLGEIHGWYGLTMSAEHRGAMIQARNRLSECEQVLREVQDAFMLGGWDKELLAKVRALLDSATAGDNR